MASSLPLLLMLLCSLTATHAQLKVYDLRASELPSNLLGTTDGFVKVFCGTTSLGKTSVRRNDINPWWEEEFNYFKAKETDVLKFEVFDSDILFDDLVGVCERPIKVGTHQHDCYLKKGGTLHYTYNLQGQRN